MVVPAPSTAAPLSSVGEFLAQTRQLTPARFEEFACDLLPHHGFVVLERPAIGVDGGADIIARLPIKEPRLFEETWIVQCKWSAEPTFAVKPTDLANFLAECSAFGACGYLLITNGSVTKKLERQINSYNGPKSQGMLKAAVWRGTELCDRVMGCCVEHVGLKWFPEWARKVLDARYSRKPNVNLTALLNAVASHDIEGAKRAKELFEAETGKGAASA